MFQYFKRIFSHKNERERERVILMEMAHAENGKSEICRVGQHSRKVGQKLMLQLLGKTFFLLLRPFTDWIRPIHIIKGNLYLK